MLHVKLIAVCLDESFKISALTVFSRELVLFCFNHFFLSFSFSRRILWLRVASTNRQPEVVASYFMDYVTELEGMILVLN